MNEEKLVTRATYAPRRSASMLNATRAKEPMMTNTDWHNAVTRRIVEITDEDENLMIDFIEIDGGR